MPKAESFHGMIYHPSSSANWYSNAPIEPFTQHEALPPKAQSSRVHHMPASDQGHYTPMGSSSNGFDADNGNFGTHGQLLAPQNNSSDGAAPDEHTFTPVSSSEHLHQGVIENISAPFGANSSSDAYYAALNGFEPIAPMTSERSRNDSMASVHVGRQSISIPPQKSEEFASFPGPEFAIQPNPRAHHSMLPSDHRKESMMIPAPYSGPLLSLPNSSRVLTPTVTGCYLHTDADVLSVLQACLQVGDEINSLAGVG